MGHKLRVTEVYLSGCSFCSTNYIVISMKYLFIIIVFLLSLGTALANAPAGNGAIKGKVTDGTDGSALIGVNVYFPDLKR